MLQLQGFSADRGRFLLTTAPLNASSSMTSVHVLEREFVDFQSWARLLRCTSSPRFPTKRLRKLAATTWMRGAHESTGWRRELQKNVDICDEWLNAAFVQLSASQQQEFLDQDLYAAAKRKRMAARADEQHARDLQQYFTSNEVVDLVLRSVLEHVKVTDAVWLEPSCGDGRFLTALLRAGAQHVVGYEIDAKVRAVAEQNVRLAAMGVAAQGSRVQAQVYEGDFLASRTCVVAPDQVVVVVGNPPFGARGDDRRDLVHHFFRHAASEWRARVIAFIVPERCARPKFIETTLEQLHGLQTDDGLVALSWQLSTQLSLSDYQFEFRARHKLKRIRQPSVLQIFICDRNYNTSQR